METFNEMVKSSVFTRSVALLFAVCVLMGALVVGMIELIRNQPLNTYVLMVLSTGIGYTLNLLGINFGVMLTPAKPTAPTPKTQQLPPTV